MGSSRDLPEEKGGLVRLDGAYEAFMGRRAGFRVWVVDWHFVASRLYSPFLMGGNDQRYRFNPIDEAWIDSTMGIEEYEYTLEHEVLERNLMRDKLWTYDQAHDFSSHTLDVQLRARNRKRIERKMRSLASDTRFGPMTERLGQIYRGYMGRRQGAHLWVVDGSRVREWLYQDFGFAGANDLAHPEFIPAGDVWLDSATSCGSLPYALVQQLSQRKLILGGMKYEDAYTESVVVRENERLRQERLCRAHEATLPAMPVGARDRGVKH